MQHQMGLLGKKLGMTSIFTEAGDRAPVTAILAGPCTVVDKRTPEKHGYAALRIGFGEKPLRTTNEPDKGVFAKAGIAPQRFIRELRVEPSELEKFEVGKAIPLDQVFKPMTFIDIQGTSKGKGYQGVMKKHHMAGFRATHGTHEFFRHGGSVGCRLTPGRVHKGKRMSGHMGDVTCTVQNLILIDVDNEKNLLLVQGAIPGAKEGLVIVRNAVKKTGVTAKWKSDVEVQEKSKNPMKASKAGGGAKKK